MKKTAAALLAAGMLLTAGFSASAVSAQGGSASVAQESAEQSPKLGTGDMLSNCIDAIANGGYTVDTDYFSYAYYYGTLEQPLRYETYVNGDNSTDKLQGKKTLANRWSSTATLGESTLIKVTANKNITLHITSDSDASHKNYSTGKGYIHYSPDTYFEYVAEGKADNGETYRISLDRRYAIVDAAENAYAIDVTMKKGDSFWLVFSSDFVTPSPKALQRWFTFQASTDYSEATRPNFNIMEAVVALREQKITALTQQANAITEAAGYTSDSVTAAQNTLADAPRRFARTESTQEVLAVYDSLLASLENAKRLTVNEDTVAAAITAASGKLDALVNGIDSQKYAPVYAEIEELYYEGLEKILTADTVTRVNYQYSKYENKILTLIYACDKGGQA